ncbi:MAG: hypothetical protein SVR04_02925 [Spirochaetota bacterium]|nr:hypothetical protein [Spirochaetota bacterium]
MISLLTTIKKTRRALEEQQAECDKWSRRVRLAEEKHRSDLLEEARRRLSEAEEARRRLSDEEQQVLQEFREVQTKYDIESSIPQQSVSTEHLLQSLYSLAGGPDTLHDELNAVVVEEELEKLKREMQEEEEKK